MPSALIVARNGGSFIINLPFNRIKEMKNFTLIVNNDYTYDHIRHLKGMINDSGIEYTSLEEIFIKVNYNE
jgi:hypothetical protein